MLFIAFCVCVGATLDERGELNADSVNVSAQLEPSQGTGRRR
ncbi:hypothetical protein ACFYE2_12545 [Kocuria sp. CPCC 205300]